MRRPGCRCREGFDGRSKGVITKGQCSGRRTVPQKVIFAATSFSFSFFSFMPFTEMIKGTITIDCIFISYILGLKSL